jgi:hypothetical protein
LIELDEKVIKQLFLKMGINEESDELENEAE